MRNGGWDRYLESFHREQPGITEHVLTNATYRSQTPYDWVADALGEETVVLDVACGSGPLAPALRRAGWVGLDSSSAELDRAAGNGAGPVARARADATPAVSGAAGAVVCSMALMVLQPVDAVLAEVRRVLRRGGTFVALVPATAPLTLRDRARYARILLALRRRIAYPNDGALRRARPLLAAARLEVVSDERRRFALVLDDASVAEACIHSLYLPDVEPRRIAAAEDVARRWVGTELGVPLRRIVATARP